ncbi:MULTISPECIES: fatty acid desaturase [Rhizobium]|uniref:fatty acid desaturase n=1 Tax=Rhizobium TaxID=379 RepID=UPI0007EB7FF6|nr:MULTISPECIES: acyl-CoA desaturase [Rhizobium]ANK89989.1 fatty acid desaturase protein [Rhizobium sp. N6212]ANK96016.1 fatty acid desaturase protein [Rhizobium sp. N621]ANL02044.1 fatty acid desaturase protein [Rhizobium esperanzae]ANL08172.1 fatty acid desaturase protein [Rhizobium sp. N1341]ANL20218.1 fatty acid desaturase protein [Rhizobium sp. N113]
MSSISTGRMIDDSSDPVKGRVVWMPAKSIWITAMTVVAVVDGPLTFSWSAVTVFVLSTAITICLGHSVGMHRLLIHRSFSAPLWLERLLVYLGTLVGMAGPFGMIYAHDIRDWAQRQRDCHDLYAHRRSFFVDAFWQMHCAVALDRPPRFVLEERERGDRFYRFLEATWMAQQIPLGLLLLILGGLPWLVWGIAVRVSVSLTGHWLVGHFAHRHGHQGWSVDDVAVQGYNLPHFGLVTFGESFHGNHHAFPESARLGIEPGQLDLGWHFIRLLAALGLASAIKLPHTIVPRDGLRGVEVSGDTGEDHPVGQR